MGGYYLNSGTKSIFDPFEGLAVSALQQHSIEAARWRVTECGEVMLRGAYQPSLLRTINAGGRSAKIATAAHAYLNEHQCGAILQDEVYLAEAAAVILL